MKSRGLVVVLALLLAVGAAAAMLLYANGVKKNAESGGATTGVVVSNQDIQANTQLDPLISAGDFKTIQVPKDAVVSSAVTDVNQLNGQTTTAPIFANEQIPSERLSSNGQSQLNQLGLTKGDVGLSVRVDGPQGVGGNIQPGDNVVIYDSASGLKFFRNLQSLINPKPAAATSSQVSLPALTVVLIPQARVVKVENPTPDAQGRTSQGSVTLTLDLTQQEAALLVYGEENGSLYFGLLSPGTTGEQLPATFLPSQAILGRKLP
jgi:Flp pilus assembly protein CpaB